MPSTPSLWRTQMLGTTAEPKSKTLKLQSCWFTQSLNSSSFKQCSQLPKPNMSQIGRILLKIGTLTAMGQTYTTRCICYSQWNWCYLSNHGLFSFQSTYKPTKRNGWRTQMRSSPYLSIKQHIMSYSNTLPPHNNLQLKSNSPDPYHCLTKYAIHLSSSQPGMMRSMGGMYNGTWTTITLSNQPFSITIEMESMYWLQPASQLLLE